MSLLSSTSTENSRLNAEIHLAISTEPLTVSDVENWVVHSSLAHLFLQYISSLCDRLFTLYRDAQNRPFVLQFLPSFITTYYDVLYQQTAQSTEDQKKVDNEMSFDNYF